MATRGTEGAREGFGVGLADLGSQLINYKLNQAANMQDQAFRSRESDASAERSHSNRKSELELSSKLSTERESALIRLKANLGVGSKGDNLGFNKAIKTGGDGYGSPEKVLLTGEDGSILQYDPSTNTIAPAGEGTGISLDQSSQMMRDAQSYADEKVDRKAGIFSSDSSDFKAYGGDRESARDQFMKEYLARQTSLVNGASPGGVGEQSLPSQQSPMGQAPVRINSQEDYQSLPSGTRFINPADGSVLIKP